MSLEQWQRLEADTQLYGRSKGLTLVGESIVFTVGLIPLLYILHVVALVSRIEAAALYLVSAVFFLGAVWVGLRWVPPLMDRLYYRQVGNVVVSAPTTPDWGRFLAPLCLLAPVAAAGVGAVDAAQAVVVGLASLGLLLYVGGRYVVREPGTEIIGAVTVLCAGLVTGVPALGPGVQSATAPEWLAGVMSAQSAALALVAWLWASWIMGAVAVHVYNRWLYSEMVKRARGYDIDEGGRHDDD